MKFLTDFTYRNLHGFARFPGDSTALVDIAANVLLQHVPLSLSSSLPRIPHVPLGLGGWPFGHEERIR